MGFSYSDIIVGNIARLVKVKNHQLLIDSMKIVLQTIPEAKLLIVGDGPLRRELEEYARSLGISDNVVFWGETEYVHDLLKIIDVFVLSSLNEGISVTILEAMALGKPVVATRVGGNPEIIINKETGILVESNDTEAMAEAIVSILNDRGKKTEFGLRGKERIEKVFNINLMVGKIEELYLQLIGKKTKGV